MKNQKYSGHAAILIVNVFFGINMAVSKDLLGGAINPMGLNALRFIFGAILVFLGVYVVTRSKSRADVEAEKEHKKA